MSGSGLKTVVEQLLASAPASAGIVQQLDLLDPAEFEPDVAMPVKPVARSGPQGGRPAGASNKSTEQWRRYILSRYRHPLVALMEIASRTPKQLAEELGLYDRQYFEGEEVACHPATGEAFKRQIEALTAALPYLAQKMPLAIEQKIEQRGLLVLGEIKMDATLGQALPVAEPGDDARVINQSPLGGDPA